MFEIAYSVGMRFSILHAVCMGITYDETWIMRESENLGSLSSHAYLDGWASCKSGVPIRHAGLEAPELIGRAERRGAVIKRTMSKVIKDTHASGEHDSQRMVEPSRPKENRKAETVSDGRNGKRVTGIVPHN